eukprot:TRINITY_DN9013_c0_g1_i3.p1 TRINITY_DN9013_c0_g1~~TRINITY_DN9013_c0_g1_i3.p1  ORF type:complete len:124 (+),score=26.37 TRINITY_DN9013_c0_g1_i3:170-541(+)
MGRFSQLMQGDLATPTPTMNTTTPPPSLITSPGSSSQSASPKRREQTKSKLSQVRDIMDQLFSDCAERQAEVRNLRAGTAAKLRRVDVLKEELAVEAEAAQVEQHAREAVQKELRAVPGLMVG